MRNRGYHGLDHRIRRAPFLRLDRRILQVERDGGCQHLDVPYLFRSRLKKQVAVLGRPASASGLEQVLQAYTDLALDAADRLLELFGKDRIRRLDADLVLKLRIVIKHTSIHLTTTKGLVDFSPFANDTQA